MAGGTGCCTSGGCRAWDRSSPHAQGSNGQQGTIHARVLLPCLLPLGLAGGFSCWMLYKEQPGASAGSRGVKIPVTAREETSPASRCRAS